MPAPAVIVGVGRADRQDDAIGRLVVRQLRNALPPHVAVLELDGEVSEVVEILSRHHAVIIVDAVQTGTAPPGTLHRFEAHSAPLPARLREVSTHGFGVGEGIELARALGRLPATVIVYGIEAEGFAIGAPPSPAVWDAIPRAVEAVLGACSPWSQPALTKCSRPPSTMRLRSPVGDGNI